MNKYTELSDFEINLLVAQSVLPETQYDVIKQTMDIIQFLVEARLGVFSGIRGTLCQIKLDVIHSTNFSTKWTVKPTNR